MLRAVLSATVLVGVALLPAPGTAAEALTLKSVTVDLPVGDWKFPEGPGVEAVTRNCLLCHSAGMVLNQPALSKAVWTAEVNKMINTFKAPVVPADVDTIIDYLTAIKGAE
jgi:hypothetical protein